jgi:pSer/pThr/pTyr-binding forkhead associated (FHA) protein
MAAEPRQPIRAADLKRVVEAERAESPFLMWRAGDDEVELLALEGRDAVTVGRRSSCDLSLAADPLASRTHARLERLGEDWLVFDNAISRNGSFVNGRRVAGHHLLVDGDQLRFGSTVVEFRNPRDDEGAVTSVSAVAVITDQLTPTQRRVLVALCRPLREGGRYATPATNAAIAAEVFLGVDAVKAHLRELYRRFNITLPQNQKRARLAELALQFGLAGTR